MNNRIGRIALTVGLGLAACAPVDPAFPPLAVPSPVRVVDGVTYRAETHVMAERPTQLHVQGTVTNTSAQERRVEFPDGCVVLLRAYRHVERTGTPSWDQRRTIACTQAVQVARIAPGRSESYETTTGAREILGDSLPEGRYYFTAYYRPGNQLVEVLAGDAELRR
jgi:ribosomal protein L11